MRTSEAAPFPLQLLNLVKHYSNTLAHHQMRIQWSTDKSSTRRVTTDRQTVLFNPKGIRARPISSNIFLSFRTAGAAPRWLGVRSYDHLHESSPPPDTAVVPLLRLTDSSELLRAPERNRGRRGPTHLCTSSHRSPIEVSMECRAVRRNLLATTSDMSCDHRVISFCRSS